MSKRVVKNVKQKNTKIAFKIAFRLVFLVVGIFFFCYGVNSYFTPKPEEGVRALQKIKLDNKISLNTDVKEKFDPIVRLHDLSGRYFCTAFVVDSHYAFTAAHCLVDENQKLRVEKIKVLNSKQEGEPILVDPAAVLLTGDVGMVMGDFSGFNKLEVVFTTFNFFENNQYKTCGYPYGQKDLMCTPFTPVEHYIFSIVGKGYLLPGQSGGPVIDTGTNKVVAVNSASGNAFIVVNPLTGILGAFGLE